MIWRSSPHVIRHIHKIVIAGYEVDLQLYACVITNFTVMSTRGDWSPLMSTKSIALAPPASLGEVIQRIATTDQLPRQRRHDLTCAVRQVSRLLGGLPADIPANPETLKRGLSLITPAAAGTAELV